MKVEFEISDAVYQAAQRYTLDPTEHAASMFEHWAALAQHNNPGVDLMTLPTLREQQTRLEKQREEQAATDVAKKQIDDATEADKAAVLATQESQAQALRDKAEAEQRQLEINAEAKAMLQAAMPELRAMIAAELQGGANATVGAAATSGKK